MPLITLPAWGRGTAERRSGAFINRRLEMHFSTLFHPACALSAPSGTFPSRGRLTIREKLTIKKPSGIAMIYTPRRFHILCAAPAT